MLSAGSNLDTRYSLCTGTLLAQGLQCTTKNRATAAYDDSIILQFLPKVEHFPIMERMNTRFFACTLTACRDVCSTFSLFTGALFLLNGVFATFIALYALAAPPFEAPDAGAHYAYIVFLHQQHTLPAIDETHAAISHQLVQQPPLYYALAATATAWLPAEKGTELLLPNPHYLRGLTTRATATVHDASPEAWLAVWIARVISALGGVLALNATVLLVRVLFPAAPWLALAVASVVALNPRFLFSAATITNDAWAAGTATLAIWLMLRAMRQPAKVTGWLWAGGALGLASLAKYSNLAIGAPAFFILLVLWQRADWRQAMRATAAVAIGSLAIAGFWYVRNWLLWGQIAPLEPMLAVLPDLARSTPLDLAGLSSTMPVLRNSYWGEFGYGVLAPPWFFDMMGYALLLASFGLVVCVLRILFAGQRDRPTTRQTVFALLLAAIWAGAVFVSLLNWMRLVNFTAQGRLLFSAITPVALLLVLGWQSFTPVRAQPFVQITIPFIFVLLAALQLGVLQEAYRLPQPLVDPLQPDRIVHATFANGIELIGADFPNGAVVTNVEPLPVTLYWRANTKIADFYTLFLHLTDSTGAPLYQFDGVPFHTQHPTPQWKPGEVFADSYLLRPLGVIGDDLAALTVGFYPHDRPDARVAVVDEGGAPVADVVTLAQVRLNRDAASCPDVPSPVAQWENGIQLREMQSTGMSGDSLTLMLRWGANRVIHTNYTVFVQVLDSTDQIVGQIDHWPQQGAYPTSTWRTDTCLDDVYSFENLPKGLKRMILGLYDEKIQRLPMIDGDDSIELVNP